MDKHAKKLQKLKENSDNIFKEALGDYKLQSPLRSPFKDVNTDSGETEKALQNPFQSPIKKKPASEGYLYRDDVIAIDTQQRIMFPEHNSTIRNPKPSYGRWTEIDWSSDNFNWLAEATFQAEVMEIKGRGSDREVVWVEKCIWADGDFRGGRFVRSELRGGTFKGNFGSGSKWLVSPFAFIDGTTKEKETILGIENITNLNKDKFTFNIIAVTPGNKIIITLEDGTVHEISVIKRLDEVSSIFTYEVYNGSTGEKATVNLRWSQLRGQNSMNFKENTVFATNSIPNMFTHTFKLPFGSPVSNVKVDLDKDFKGVDWSDTEKSQEELASSQEKYDLVNAPLFGITEIPGQPIVIPGKRGRYRNNVGRVFFNFMDNNQLKGYKQTVDNLNKKVLRSDLRKLKSYLEAEIIDGAPKQYPFLAALIGKNTKDSELDPNFSGSLSRIETMLRDFIGAMVLKVRKKEGEFDKPNNKVQDMAKKGIRVFLGLEEPDAPTVKKVKTPASKSDDNKKVKKIKLKEEESIREKIREIIKNM